MNLVVIFAVLAAIVVVAAALFRSITVRNALIYLFVILLIAVILSFLLPMLHS